MVENLPLNAMANAGTPALRRLRRTWPANLFWKGSDGGFTEFAGANSFETPIRPWQPSGSGLRSERFNQRE